MRMNRALTILLVTFLTGISTTGVGQDEIKKKQAELQKLREQIQGFEKKIKEQQQNEKNTLELLDTYDRKATVLRRLISKLKAQEKDLQEDIAKTRSDLAALERQMDFLKQHYAKYVSSVYTAGKLQDIELLFTSNSINQFYIRTEYLKRFTDQRRTDAKKITGKQTEIEKERAKLENQLGDHRKLIAEKGAEEDKLELLASKRKDMLFQIRKDKKSIQREIDRKLKAAGQLEELIANLIEQERIRKEREAQKNLAGKLPQPPPAAGTFGSRKGKLRWPVSEGSVVASFGNQKHPTLKTITQNTGIDISVKAGSPVSVVADGEVTTIWWLPGYGNLLIVDHRDGYRTVYAHLSEIQVSEGQSVKEGDVIASSGESLEGARLHFEVWNYREKQNPEQWLSRR